MTRPLVFLRSITASRLLSITVNIGMPYTPGDTGFNRETGSTFFLTLPAFLTNLNGIDF